MCSSTQQNVSDGVLIDLNVKVEPVDFVVVGCNFVFDAGFKYLCDSSGLSFSFLEIGFCDFVSGFGERGQFFYSGDEVDGVVMVVDRWLSVLVAFQVGEVSG